MRWIAFWFLLLPAAVPAQEPAGAEAWTLAQPPSRPTGEPRTLRLDLPAGRPLRVRVVQRSVHTNSQSPGRLETVMEFEVAFAFTRAEGEEPLHGLATLDLRRLEAGGRDVTAQAGASLQGTRVSARLDERGEPLPGSVKVLSGQGERLGEGDVFSLLGAPPARQMRIGESWEEPAAEAERIGRGLGMKGGEAAGRLFRVCEAVEERGGAPCVRIRSLVHGKVTGGALALRPGVEAKGDLRFRGERTYWHGLDGVFRGGVSWVEMEMDLAAPDGRRALLRGRLEKEIQAPAPAAAAAGEGPFRVRLETSQGDVVIEVRPDWCPLGAKRFRELVAAGFYDGCRFFRVVPGFVVQFGLPADPKVAAAWKARTLADDPVRASNLRGTLAFATAGPGTRTTQVFFNLRDNAALDGRGFAPFARIVEGLEAVDALHAGYGDGPPRGRGPDQERIEAEGNAYLEREFPNLDFIKRAALGAAPASGPAGP